jgi:hypothetical protein
MIKVLLFDKTNAFLTPGGKTTHALKLQKELLLMGVDIQFSQWWNINQENFDIIHLLTPDTEIARLAKLRGKKVFLSLIFDFESSKPEFQKRLTKFKNLFISLLPQLFREKAYWECFKYVDKIQFMHSYDRMTALSYFGKFIDNSKTTIIPHAYDPDDIGISESLSIIEFNLPDKYLVSCANISSRKQSILLAQYAKLAKVPTVFIGKGDLNDPYFQLFKEEIDNEYVYYLGYIDLKTKDYVEANASGFVLLSLGESGCIAVYEAAAYKLPLLLSNLPWAWGYDSPKNIYFCDQNKKNLAIDQLKEFYMNSGKLQEFPFAIHTWSEVAKYYLSEYKSLI